MRAHIADADIRLLRNGCRFGPSIFNIFCKQIFIARPICRVSIRNLTNTYYELKCILRGYFSDAIDPDFCM